MNETLTMLLADYRSSHDEIQMDCFITAANGGTPYGMYCQALRELHKRLRGLRELYGDREIKKLDIEEAKASSNADKRAMIGLRRMELALEGLDETIRETEREFLHFYAQANGLKEIVGELTPERRRHLDIETWVHKIKAIAAMEYITMGRLTEKPLHLAQYLPLTIRQSLLSDLRKDSELVSWFERLEYEAFTTELTVAELPKLLEENIRSVGSTSYSQE